MCFIWLVWGRNKNRDREGRAFRLLCSDPGSAIWRLGIDSRQVNQNPKVTTLNTTQTERMLTPDTQKVLRKTNPQFYTQINCPFLLQTVYGNRPRPWKQNHSSLSQPPKHPFFFCAFNVICTVVFFLLHLSVKRVGLWHNHVLWISASRVLLLPKSGTGAPHTNPTWKQVTSFQSSPPLRVTGYHQSLGRSLNCVNRSLTGHLSVSIFWAT